MSKTPAEITAKLVEPFPHSVIEDKQGKRYIAAEQIIWRLIEATDNTYEWSIDSAEYRNDGALRDRKDKDGNVIAPAPTVCVVHGTLTIPGLGSRADSGVQEIEAGGGADAAYKGAVSDCIKRCARLFGVGLRQLYMGEDVPEHLKAPKERAAERKNTASQRPQNGQSATTTGQGANAPQRPLASQVRNGRQSTRVDTTEAAARNLTPTPREDPEYQKPEPDATLSDAAAKKDAFKTTAEAAFAVGTTDAIEKLCDSADSPGKWVMIATLAPSLEAIEAVGLAAVDRGAFTEHLGNAINARKAELAGK